ncbi:MAG: hypothetical protein H0W72_03275, partial [Planctomycetes bacterium]|nr:hypothetical protein [Planctomycetota bacterium]
KGLRSEEVDSASALIDAAAAAYVRQQASGRPALLAEVAAWFDDVVATEEVRLAAKLGAVDRAQLRYGLERVGNKLQHQLLRFLRERADDPAAEAAVREILGMQGSEIGKGSPEVRKSGSPEVS